MKQFSMAHLPPAEYEAIESALLGTTKGRWFLREFLDRNRDSETVSMLNAVARLHDVVIGEPGKPQQASRDIKALIEEMRRARRYARGLDAAAQARHLQDVMEHVEAQLMAIDEFLSGSSESRFIELSERLELRGRAGDPRDRTAKLFGELSAMVAPDDIGSAYEV